MPTRRDERNEAVRAERRREILDHALALFAERGYAETTIRMIAESIGMSQGLLYRYFASKELLLHAIFEQSMQDVRASFAAADTGADPQERLERLIRSAFTIIRDHRRFWQLGYSVRMQRAVVSDLGEALHAWTVTIRQTLEGYLRTTSADDPVVAATILFALIDGVCQHYVLDPEGYPLDAVAEAIVAKYRPLR